MLRPWLNYQFDLLTLDGDGEQRHFEDGGDGGRRCRVNVHAEMDPKLEVLFIDSDDTSVTLFGTTFTGPAGTTSYRPA
jgi:hypothetical protein